MIVFAPVGSFLTPTQFDSDVGFCSQTMRTRRSLVSRRWVGFSSSSSFVFPLEERNKPPQSDYKLSDHDEDKNPTRIDVRRLARSLRECPTAESVGEVFSGFEELPPPQVYSSLIKSLGIDGKLDSCFAIVDWLKANNNSSSSSNNVFVYNSLLGAVKTTREYGQVERVMEEMEEQGIHPNIVTYNTLMSIYMEQDRHHEALDMFDRIEHEGLVASPVTYSTALVAYWKLDDAFGALRFYVDSRPKFSTMKCPNEEVRKLERLIIRICYQLMRKCIVSATMEASVGSIIKLVSELERANVPVGRVEFEKLVWACTQPAHYTIAKEFYQRIRELDDGAISLSVCNHLIWLMGKSKKWWAALEIYEDLLVKGPSPNNLSVELMMSHFNILLSSAGRRGIWRWGLRLIDKMQSKGLKPGTREWNAVLVACSRASQTKMAVQVFKRMIESEQKPTILSYGALLNALEKAELYEDAFSVWHHMSKVGVKPNLHAYTILISIYIGKGDLYKVETILNDMVSEQIKPTVVTYNAIISACGKRKLGRIGYEWFLRMKMNNVTPNEITYQVLIDGLSRDKVDSRRLLVEVFLQGRNLGFNLSAKTYNLALEGCRGMDVDVSVLGCRPDEKKKQYRKNLDSFGSL